MPEPTVLQSVTHLKQLLQHIGNKSIIFSSCYTLVDIRGIPFQIFITYPMWTKSIFEHRSSNASVKIHVFPKQDFRVAGSVRDEDIYLIV